MEPEILKHRIKKNYIALVKDLEPRKLVSYLYQDGIFDEDDMDDVRSEPTRKKQAETLLYILNRRDCDGFSEVVLEALRETQPHLAKLLEKPVATERSFVDEQKTYCSPSEEVQMMFARLPAPSHPTEHEHVTSYNSQSRTEKGSTIDIPAPDESDSSLVRPTKFDMISPLYRPHLLESVYKMTSSPRGLAVIINMNKFNPKHSPKEELVERIGSEVDAKGLKDLFHALDFETEMLVDLPKDELLQMVQKISKSDFSKLNCFVLCIMSHGKEDFFYAYDGGTITVKIICDMFNNSHCKTLCGKPKLFFIQACRGKKLDFGTVVKDGPSGTPTENEESRANMPKKTEHSFNITPKGPSTGEHADILMAYSSVEGFSSYRNTISGSRFIRSLIEVFKSYACMEDVESMMTRVIYKVNSQGDVGSKQVPKPETTLTKKVFFWPGIIFKH